MAEYDAAFAGLPERLRHKVDRAFDKATGLSSSRAGSSSAAGGFTTEHAAEPGGFLLDDAPGGFLPPSPPAGGFLPPSPPAHAAYAHDESLPNDRISLSEIPRALQLLDLSPSDEDVLAVFRNAAAGWDGKVKESGSESEEQYVSRSDWRAVCAALLDVGEEVNDAASSDVDAEERAGEGENGLGREPMDSNEESDGAGSSDEYVEESPVRAKKRRRAAAAHPKMPARKTRARARQARDSTDEDEDADAADRPLTARQRRECLAAFSLFFPDVDEDVLVRKRIGVKELTRASDLLKEKLKVEEARVLHSAYIHPAHDSLADDGDARGILKHTRQDNESRRLREDDGGDAYGVVSSTLCEWCIQYRVCHGQLSSQSVL
jgi:hypothetical protein